MSSNIDLEALIAQAQSAAMAAKKATEDHMAVCTEVICERCGRLACSDCKAPVPAENIGQRCPACRRKAMLLAQVRPALETLPKAFDAAELDAPWLAALVGGGAIQLARQSLTASGATFVGAAGAGKTSLAVAMFRALLRAEVVTAKPRWCATHLYVSSFALAKARTTAGLGAEVPLIERALSAPLVLVDELGGEDPRYASAVTEVIYERHAQDLPTWITTGVGPKEIASRYGGGIARRVFEGSVMFKLGGKS